MADFDGMESHFPGETERYRLKAISRGGIEEDWLFAVVVAGAAKF